MKFIKKTPYNFRYCWTHFYFNYKGFRFYLSIIVTLILEAIASKVGFADEWTVWALFTSALYDATKYVPFLLLKIIIIILALLLAYMGISLFLYKLFFRKVDDGMF